MKTIVSKDICIGCGLCPSLSPELYKMDNDGKAKAVKDELSDDEIGEAKMTASSCPVDAITVG